MYHLFKGDDFISSSHVINIFIMMIIISPSLVVTFSRDDYYEGFPPSIRSGSSSRFFIIWEENDEKSRREGKRISVREKTSSHISSFHFI